MVRRNGIFNGNTKLVEEVQKTQWEDASYQK